jgi:hypothetical protein
LLLVAWKAPAGVVGNRAISVANKTQHSTHTGDSGGLPDPTVRLGSVIGNFGPTTPRPLSCRIVLPYRDVQNIGSAIISTGYPSLPDLCAILNRVPCPSTTFFSICNTAFSIVLLSKSWSRRPRR